MGIPLARKTNLEISDLSYKAHRCLRGRFRISQADLIEAMTLALIAGAAVKLGTGGQATFWGYYADEVESDFVLARRFEAWSLQELAKELKLYVPEGKAS